MLRSLVLVTLAALSVAPAVSLGAQKVASLTVNDNGSAARVTTVITGGMATKVAVTMGPATVPLKRISGGAAKSTWRSGVITGPRRTGLLGAAAQRAQVKITLGTSSRAILVRPVVRTPPGPAPAPGAGPAPAPGGAAPAPGATTPPAATSLFGTPPTKLTGQDAVKALQTYVVDMRFTDCAAGWPNCSVEHRYSLFANGDHYYCRLTPTSGADVNSYGNSLSFTGIEQETTGAWAISYSIVTYGNTVNYRWDVSPTGAATGQYFGPGVSPSGTPTEVISNMQWTRGAKNCSY